MIIGNIEAKTLNADLTKININSTLIDDFTIEIEIVDVTPIQALIDMYTYVQPLPPQKSDIEINSERITGLEDALMFLMG